MSGFTNEEKDMRLNELKKIGLENVKVGILLGSWSKMVCPNCGTVNWINVHGNVVNIVHCHKCSGYFWPDQFCTSFYCNSPLVLHNENMSIYEGKEEPEGEDFPEILG